jgi:hypothetical protein
LPSSASNPGNGVSCRVPHLLGHRAVNLPTPAVPDIDVWKKMHSDYERRATEQK